MQPKDVTLVVILAATIFLVSWNVFVGLMYGKEATISAVIVEQSRKHLIIPFVIGGVCFHWFWSYCD